MCKWTLHTSIRHHNRLIGVLLTVYVKVAYFTILLHVSFFLAQAQQNAHLETSAIAPTTNHNKHIAFHVSLMSNNPIVYILSVTLEII